MKYILLMLLILNTPCIEAQVRIDSSVTSIKKFNDAQWNKITANHKYPVPKKINEKQPEQKSHFNFKMPSWAGYFFYAVIIILLGILIYRILINLSIPKNKTIEIPIMYEEDDEVGYDYAGLERWLAEASGNSDYRRAIRFSYLIAIRDLAEKQLIVAAKDKTNYQYLLELSTHPLREPFNSITRAFEKTWYGDIIPLQGEYNSFEEMFRLFIFRLQNETKRGGK